MINYIAELLTNDHDRAAVTVWTVDLNGHETVLLDCVLSTEVANSVLADFGLVSA